MLTDKDLEDCLILDMLPYARQIEAQFGPLLKDPTPGVYRAEDIDPVLIPGKEYFHKVNGVLVPVTDINATKTAVYDKCEKQVIPGFHMRHKESMLSDKPRLPQRGTKIVELMFNQHLDNFVSWRKHSADYSGRIRTHFEPEAFSDAEFESYLDIISFETCKDLADWLGDRRWNVFLSGRYGTALHIGQYGDYRIKDWMERYNTGQIGL